MTDCKSNGDVTRSPFCPDRSAAHHPGASGLFCSWANPKAWPNSWTAITSIQNSRLFLQSVPQLLKMKFKTIPSVRPAMCFPNTLTCGPSSAILMRIPLNAEEHRPQPVNCTIETCSHVRATPVYFLIARNACGVCHGALRQIARRELMGEHRTQTLPSTGSGTTPISNSSTKRV